MSPRIARSAAGAALFAMGLATGWAISTDAQTPTPVTQTLATAQPPVAPVMMNGLPVMTGSDVGVRIDGQAGARVNGTLVVRVGGVWKEVQTIPHPGQ